MKVRFIHDNAVIKDAVAALVAVVFAVSFVTFDWVSLAGEFVDRKVYFEQFKYEEGVLEYLVFDSVLDYFKNEYLWHYLVGELVELLDGDVGVLLSFVSFFSTFVIVFFFVRNTHPLYSIVLASPVFVTFTMSQMRLAFCVSLLLLAVMVRFRYLAIFLVGASLFIHSASVIFIIIYIASSEWLCRRLPRLSGVTLNAYLVSTGFILAIVLGPLRNFILNLLGDRRIAYDEVSSSLSYNSFWIGLFLVLLMSGVGGNKFQWPRYSLILLSLITFGTFLDVYTLRFLAASLPVVFIGLYNLKFELKVFVLLVYFIYLVLQWMYWVGDGFSGYF